MKRNQTHHAARARSIAVGFVLAALLIAGERAARADPLPHVTVLFMDGSRLEGELAEYRPNEYVELKVRGRLRYVPWRYVLNVLGVPPWVAQRAAEEARAPTRAAWRSFRGFHLTADVRAEPTLQIKTHGSYTDGGAAIGLAASFGVRYVLAGPDPTDRRNTWGAISATMDGGFFAGDYSLGAHPWDGHGTMTAIKLGPYLAGQLGIGSPRERGGWSGAVLGLGYAPAYVRYFEGDLPRGGTFNPLGVRLTTDLGSLHPERSGPDPIIRLTLSWLPRFAALPHIISVGVGCAFY